MLFGICLLIFIGMCITAACEPTLPVDYHRNWRLEAHDSQLVREGKMTQRQFEKNMNNGKYKLMILKSLHMTKWLSTTVIYGHFNPYAKLHQSLRQLIQGKQ